MQRIAVEHFDTTAKSHNLQTQVEIKAARRKSSEGCPEAYSTPIRPYSSHSCGKLAFAALSSAQRLACLSEFAIPIALHHHIRDYLRCQRKSLIARLDLSLQLRVCR